MTLSRWDPFRGLMSNDEMFDRLLSAGSRSAWMPALDVRETEDRFEVTVDLPGLEPEDVSVTFESGVLTVSGKREFESAKDEDTFHRIERSYGSFARSVRLPRTADPERIDATFDKGVLTVGVPKVEAAKPRTIEVKAR